MRPGEYWCLEKVHGVVGLDESHLVSLVPICCLDSSLSSSVCMGRMFFSSSSLLEGRLLSLMARESFLSTFCAREPKPKHRDQGRPLWMWKRFTTKFSLIILYCCRFQFRLHICHMIDSLPPHEDVVSFHSSAGGHNRTISTVGVV